MASLRENLRKKMEDPLQGCTKAEMIIYLNTTKKTFRAWMKRQFYGDDKKKYLCGSTFKTYSPEEKKLIIERLGG